mmetsp:Transcript_1103/g.2384  ORF Transcript_1103/g.2384 Transcript_1103/m.2384 type:complete len:228 (-) Transcript_1103:101-784(-)
MSSAKVKVHSLSTCRSTPQWSFSGKKQEKLGDSSVPGPGKYGVPSVNEKYKSSPSFGFGSSQREFTKKFTGLPGPGTHTPFDPNQTSPMWGFGSGSRIPMTKETGVPAPGKYNLPSSLEKKTVSLGGKRQGPKPKSNMPGPGAYMPQYEQVESTPARLLLNSTENREKTSFTRNYSCAPGPGSYPLMKEIGGNVCTRSCPSFSFSSRRKPARSDSTPGPCFTVYSQF